MHPTALVYSENAAAFGPARATVVAVHGEGYDNSQLLPILSKLADSCDIVSPLAWRTLNPRAPLMPAERSARAWFFHRFDTAPEPATFGDCLWQLEQFVYDVRERQAREAPIILVGYGQGAVLVTTLGAVIPEILTGVLALNGYLPSIPGWSPPAEDLHGLPFLLVHDQGAMQHGLSTEAAVELRIRGGEVEVSEVASILGNVSATSEVVADWVQRLLARQASASGHHEASG